MMTNVKILTARDAAALARPGSRIYVAGCLGEPVTILDVVAGEPDLWRDVTMTGTFIPGVNRRRLADLGTQSRVETIFATEGLNAADPAGRISVHPLHYSEFDALLARPGHVDLAYFEVPPPGPDGMIGLGLASDFTPSVIGSGARLVGIVNEFMPDVRNGPRFPMSRFAALVRHDHTLASYDAGPIDEATATIAGLIATEIRPGDTIQLGLGKVQSAVLKALKDRADLGFHAGMVSTPIRPLIESGVFSRGITTGVALGLPDFLAWCGTRTDICFSPVSRTHAHATLSAIDNFVSINSVIEVDLFGQANADTIDGRQISGQGGLVDFVRGALASLNGRSILALPATARGGSASRIVPCLKTNTPVAVSRADVDIVVTEYGVAYLRHASLEERATRLIAIAAPGFREELASRWRNMHYGSE